MASSLLTESAAVLSVADLVPLNAQLLLALFFFGFYAAAFVAIYWSRNYVRKTFVAFLFAFLILFNIAIPVTPAPFSSWSHFSEPVPETAEYQEIRLVDEDGNELKFDNRMTLEFDGMSAGTLTRSMLSRWDDQKNEEVARRLLYDAEAYREEVRNPSRTRFLEFPRHGQAGTWTPEILDEYDRFVGVRIYQMNFTTTSDGTEITHHEEELLLEIYPLDVTPDGETPPNTAPPQSINRTTPDAEKAYEEPFVDLYPFETISDSDSLYNASVSNQDRGNQTESVTEGAD